MYLPGDTVHFSFQTHNATTGALADADSGPTGSVRRNGTADGGVSVTITHPPAATGDYQGSFTLPATYALGDSIELLLSATVAAVADKTTVSFGKLDRTSAALARPYNNVYHVRASGGSDSNDGKGWGSAWATINKAATTATTGDLVLIGPGTFANGSTRIIPAAGVHWRGAGAGRTILTWTAGVIGNRTHWVAKSDSVLEDMSLEVPTASNWGTFGGSTDDDPTVDNLLVRRCRIRSDVDCVTFSNLTYFRNVRFEDCFFFSLWDGLQLAGTTAGKGGEILLVNCEIVCLNTIAEHYGKCVICEPGSSGATYKATFINTVFRSDTTGGSVQAQAISVNGSQNVLTFIECSIESLGNTPQDFYLQNTPTIRIGSGTVFDRTKVTGDGISYAPDRQVDDIHTIVQSHGK